jgi:hypothetical protein
MNRYYIDKRIGCIAVRDRERIDPDYNGLHADMEGVVQYWGGQRTKKKCSECGHVQFAGWDVSEADQRAAAELCDSLNLKPNAPADQTATAGMVRRDVGLYHPEIEMTEEERNIYDREANYANREDTEQSSRSGLHWTHS